MAYIDGKWLARQERQERINLVAERAKKLQELYETGEVTEYYMDTLLADIDELEKLKGCTVENMTCCTSCMSISLKKGIQGIRIT